MCVALGKAVIQHQDFTKLAAAPDCRAAILNHAVQLARAVDKTKAKLVISDSMRLRHSRQVEDIEWCCAQPGSKWEVCTSAAAPTGPTFHAITDTDTVADFAAATRRLKQTHGCRGRFVDYPLAWLAA